MFLEKFPYRVKFYTKCPNMYFGFVCIKRTPILLMRISYAVMRRLQPSKTIGKRMDVLIF